MPTQKSHCAKSLEKNPEDEDPSDLLMLAINPEDLSEFGAKL